MLKNKRGEIGSTLTWIVATFIILLMLILYISGVLFISKAKGVDKSFNVAEPEKNLSFIFTKKLVAFIDMPFNNNTSLYQLVLLIEKDTNFGKEMQRIFSSAAEKFFREISPSVHPAILITFNLFVYDNDSAEFKKDTKIRSYEWNYPISAERMIFGNSFSEEIFLTSKSKLKIQLTTI